MDPVYRWCAAGRGSGHCMGCGAREFCAHGAVIKGHAAIRLFGPRTMASGAR